MMFFLAAHSNFLPKALVMTKYFYHKVFCNHEVNSFMQEKILHSQITMIVHGNPPRKVRWGRVGEFLPQRDFMVESTLVSRGMLFLSLSGEDI